MKSFLLLPVVFPAHPRAAPHLSGKPDFPRSPEGPPPFPVFSFFVFFFPSLNDLSAAVYGDESGETFVVGDVRAGAQNSGAIPANPRPPPRVGVPEDLKCITANDY